MYRKALCLLGSIFLLFAGLLSAFLTWGVSQPAHAASLQNGYFTPYVDVTLQPTFPLTQTAQQSGVKLYTLAFILDSGGCQASWGGTTPINQGFMQSDISNLRALGGDVIASFGGEVGTELATSCSSANALQAQYQAVIDTYHLTHIDFDIEGSPLSNTAANKLRDQAIIGLQQAAQSAGKQLTISLTIPVAASGLLGDGLQFLQQAVTDHVNFTTVNIMTMDLGGSADGDTANLAIDAATNFYSQLAGLLPNKSSNQLWSMIGMTPMIGLNGSGGELFTEQDASSLVTFAQRHNMGELAMWSAGRDQPCPGGASTISTTCSGITQQPLDFSKILNQFNGSSSLIPDPPAPPAGNLVSNPGFETGNTAGWFCDPSDVVIGSPVHSGSHALQLTGGGITTGFCAQTIGVQPNQTYTLTGFMQGSFATLGASGYSNTFTTNSSYTQLTVTFTTSASTTFVTIFARSYFAAGNALLDDVTLSGPGTTGGGPTPTPTAVPTATPAPPTITPTLTVTPTPAPGGAQPWDSQSHAYHVGDLVTFQGHTYKCIQPHTSQPGWDPVSVPALWQLVS